MRRAACASHYDGVKKGETEPATIGICGEGSVDLHLTDRSMAAGKRSAALQTRDRRTRPSWPRPRISGAAFHAAPRPGNVKPVMRRRVWRGEAVFTLPRAAVADNAWSEGRQHASRRCRVAAFNAGQRFA